MKTICEYCGMTVTWQAICPTCGTTVRIVREINHNIEVVMREIGKPDKTVTFRLKTPLTKPVLTCRRVDWEKAGMQDNNISL